MTSSFLTPTIDLFGKKRRKRKRLLPVTPNTKSTASLDRFSAYLKRKLQSTECTGSSFHNQFRSLIKLKRVKRFSLRGKNLMRFRPYQFLGFTIPLRSFELSPSNLFSSMALKFGTCRSGLRNVPYRQFFLTRPHTSVIPLTKVTHPHFRNSVLFTFSRLPRRLRVRLR